MRVLFDSPDPDGARMRRDAVRRVLFAMRRLTWLVPRARVQLHDVNGPGGGVDKRCRIELRTRGAGAVVITALARDWQAALDGAVSRAARSAVRLWRRSRTTQRPGAQVAWPEGRAGLVVPAGGAAFSGGTCRPRR